MHNHIFSLTLFLIFLNSLSAQNENTINEIEFKVNKIRSTGYYCGKIYFPPTDPVCWNNPLFKSAKYLVEDNYLNNGMSHYSKKGEEGLSARVKSFGYPIHTIAEIIVSSPRGLDVDLEVWLNSPKHCANLLNSEYKDFGIAKKGKFRVMVLGTVDDYFHYWFEKL